jgi:hypothetical protein
MSIYSGFAKRAQETYYDKLLFKTIEVLCRYIFQTRFSSSADINEAKFTKQILKLYKALVTMEKSKHLEPNMSPALFRLAKSAYCEYKKELTGSTQEKNSHNDSNGFIEALSSSQFKFSDDISNLGSELSSGFNLKHNLEVIKENPERRPSALRNPSLDAHAGEGGPQSNLESKKSKSTTNHQRSLRHKIQDGKSSKATSEHHSLQVTRTKQEQSPPRGEMMATEVGLKMPKIPKERMTLETMKNITRGARKPLPRVQLANESKKANNMSTKNKWTKTLEQSIIYEKSSNVTSGLKQYDTINSKFHNSVMSTDNMNQPHEQTRNLNIQTTEQ